MQGSRLRPFLCVGLAYLVIAVVVPYALIGTLEPDIQWTAKGTLWSLLGGATGALGALGIILAFNSGGKPIFVMPLVFGGAPVVNSFTEIIGKHLFDQINAVFYAGLILVIAGAVTVLIFAPKAHKPAPSGPNDHPQ